MSEGKADEKNSQIWVSPLVLPFLLVLVLILCIFQVGWREGMHLFFCQAADVFLFFERLFHHPAYPASFAAEANQCQSLCDLVACSCVFVLPGVWTLQQYNYPVPHHLCSAPGTSGRNCYLGSGFCGRNDISDHISSAAPAASFEKQQRGRRRSGAGSMGRRKTETLL